MKIPELLQGKRTRILIILAILIVFAATYFLVFHQTAKERVESLILQGKFSSASELVRTKGKELGPFMAKEYSRLIKGTEFFQEKKYLESYSLLYGFETSLITSDRLRHKVSEIKASLFQRLRSLQAGVEGVLNTYSASMKQNNLEQHLSLFTSSSYNMDTTKALSKKELRQKKAGFFKKYATKYHRLRLLNLGQAKDGKIEVTAEEYQRDQSKSTGEEKFTGVKKKFTIVNQGGLKIEKEQTIESFLNADKTSIEYKNFKFDIKNNNSLNASLSIRLPNGKELNEGQFFSAELSIDDYDNDGSLEILIKDFSGGAHCCYSIKIFKLMDNSYTASSMLELGDSDFEFQDFNNDGHREFKCFNPQYGYQFTSFAESVFPPVVYEYLGGKFVESTSKYKDLLKNDFQRNDELLKSCLKAHGYRLDQTETDIEVFIPSPDFWMGNYRAYLAGAVTDKMLLEGKNSAYKYFRKYYNVPKTQKQLWNKIIQLSNSYGTK